MKHYLKYIGLFPFVYGMHLWNIGLSLALCLLINYLKKLFKTI
jgi:hypothetical protein